MVSRVDGDWTAARVAVRIEPDTLHLAMRQVEAPEHAEKFLVHLVTSPVETVRDPLVVDAVEHPFSHGWMR